MRNSNRWAVLAAALSLAAPVSAKLLEDTVASVNGKPILLSEYQKELSSALDYWAKAEPDAMRDPGNVKKLRETTLEELINREILYQEGEKRKIKVRERDIENGIAEIKQRFMRDESGRELPPEEAEAAFQKQLKTDGLNYSQFRERLSKQIMARKLIDEEVKAKLRQPEEAEVKAYFVKVSSYIASKSTDTPRGMDEEEGLAFRQIAQQVRAMGSEQVRVARILIKTSPGASDKEKKRALKTAQDIRKRLVTDPSQFDEIAKEESEDPDSAARGGDLGYLIRGVAPAQFEKVAFSLPVGEISEPIETEVGYNIIQVLEKKAAKKPDYDKIKDDLAKFLMNLSFQKELEAYVKNLKAKAVIERSLTTIQ
ncbi:MAG: peptidylprolyl isomerase [Elusimicrobia bacterium]|nr:peptidylprolyl isomerase [Elusimicrobiota bacterium]